MENEKLETERKDTKLCKYCQSEIPKKAKVCPNCKKKQGGILKWIGIAFVVLIVIGALGGGGDNNKSTIQTENNSNDESNMENVIAETETESGTVEDPEEQEKEQKEIEYIPVTATELSDALSNNAMKAQNDYKDKYLEITGKLGNIDSNGKYIGIDSDKDFDLTNIQCYIKSDEQKETIINMSKGDSITVKGYCKDMGEVLGYQIDIDAIN